MRMDAMRESKINICAIIGILFLCGTVAAEAQQCKSLEASSPKELVSYLQAAQPSERNAQCIWYAIKGLEDRPYEPAIPILVKLLDFRRPQDGWEKQGVFLQGNYYPAMDALSALGKKSSPNVLEAIKAEATSQQARENAVRVWMLWLYRDNLPDGVATLRKELEGSSDPAIQQRLNWAIARAQTMCDPKEKCSAAAKGNRTN